MGALDRLKNKIGESDYSSNFDFASCEMSPEDISFIREKEKNLARNFKKLSENTKQICSDLYEVSLKFKADKNFMAWYEANGMNKDMISRILKRHSLYVEFPEHTSRISALSESAVKILTHKDVTFDDREAIITGNIVMAEDIKTLLLPCMEKNKKEFQKKKKEIPFNNKFSFRVYKDFKKKIKISENLSDLVNVKSEISDLKKALAELEAEITAKEKAEENKNNLKLTETFPAYKNLESDFIHVIEKEKDEYIIGTYVNFEAFKTKDKSRFLYDTTGIESFEKAEAIFNNIVMLQKVQRIE